jgi:ankyrin repeat protein
MHIAAMEGHTDMIKYLEGKNLDLEVQREDGSRPIHLAAKNNKI